MLNRAVGRMRIFGKERDFEAFEEVIQEAKARMPMRVLAWCVMPNHVHAVVRPLEGFELPRIVHSWKSFTSNRANEILGRKGAFWQAEAYDHLVRDANDLRRVVRYVLRNPVAAGLRGWKWVGCAAWVRGEIASGAWGEDEAR